MNHNIGDTITVADYSIIRARTSIKDLEHRYDENNAYFVSAMQQFCNQSFTIYSINKYGYNVIGHSYTLSDYMLTSFTPSTEQPYEYW